MRRTIIILAALAGLAGPVLAVGPAWAQSPNYRVAHSDDPAADRNAYLLTLLETDAAARTALAGEPDLKEIARRLGATRPALMQACTRTDACPVGQMMLSDAEVARAGATLARLAGSGAPLNRLVRAEMRPSGRFQKYAGLDDAGLMRAAWTETAAGVNRIYRVYGQGEPPRYRDIDSMTYVANEQQFRNLIRAALSAEADDGGTEPFFAAWAQLAFDLLTISQRDEAGRYEPLDRGENAAAFARARKLDWKAKPYTAIVVPGQGLELPDTGLSPGGAFRIRLAVKRWRQGLAPFLIVSGGHVHPNKTEYAEAIEMKRALIARYGVPADAIVVDPYARHTTTNLRNAVRLLFAMGAPAGRPMLITTSQDQSLYIESKPFATRCAAELGYQPVTGMTRISPFDLTGVQNLISLHADPQDPLDP